jgi:Fe-S cluster biogenesis protein NfuA
MTNDETTSDEKISVTSELTPNPATCKFVFSHQVTDGSREFASSKDTDTSPLAAKIFGFPWTQSVFIGPDFVTVTKQDWVEWNFLAEPLGQMIEEHLNAGEPVLIEIVENLEAEDANDTPLVKNIKQALNRDIRPVVALDGGDIVFAKYEDQKLYLKMKGSCAGCPSSQATLKDGIEVRMKELFPEIIEVLAVP